MKNRINKKVDPINGFQRIAEDSLLNNENRVNLFSSMYPDIASSKNINPFVSQFKDIENNNKFE